MRGILLACLRGLGARVMTSIQRAAARWPSTPQGRRHVSGPSAVGATIAQMDPPPLPARAVPPRTSMDPPTRRQRPTDRPRRARCNSPPTKRSAAWSLARIQPIRNRKPPAWEDAQEGSTRLLAGPSRASATPANARNRPPRPTRVRGTRGPAGRREPHDSSFPSSGSHRCCVSGLGGRARGRGPAPISPRAPHRTRAGGWDRTRSPSTRLSPRHGPRAPRRSRSSLGLSSHRTARSDGRAQPTHAAPRGPRRRWRCSSGSVARPPCRPRGRGQAGP